MQVYEYTCNCWDYECFPKSRFASEYGWQSYSGLSSFAEMISPEYWSYWNESVMRSERHEYVVGIFKPLFSCCVSVPFTIVILLLHTHPLYTPYWPHTLSSHIHKHTHARSKTPPRTLMHINIHTHMQEIHMGLRPLQSFYIPTSVTTTSSPG